MPEPTPNPLRLPRRSWNRFQTAVFSACVRTRFNAFFDPYAEPQPRLQVTRRQMESIPRVEIPGS